MRLSTTLHKLVLRAQLFLLNKYVAIADWKADRAWAAKNKQMKRHERFCDRADWAEGEARVVAAELERIR